MVDDGSSMDQRHVRNCAEARSKSNDARRKEEAEGNTRMETLAYPKHEDSLVFVRAMHLFQKLQW